MKIEATEYKTLQEIETTLSEKNSEIESLNKELSLLKQFKANYVNKLIEKYGLDTSKQYEIVDMEFKEVK